MQPEGVNENFKRLHGNKATGSTGEWRVESSACAGMCWTPLRKPPRKAGIAATDDFNRGTNEGRGLLRGEPEGGWRWNTAKAFLRPTCYGRPNFEMWTSAQATQLIIETQPDGSRRCTGVKVWDGHEMVTAHAAREVVLSAGAVNSPQLLQLSGIGPAALLRQHGH